VQAQAKFLLMAMRQKMLAAPLAYHRKFLDITTPRVAMERLTEMMHELLRELHDMPRKVIDPNWLESLDDESES
jgi:hypothetical protein